MMTIRYLPWEGRAPAFQSVAYYATSYPWPNEASPLDEDGNPTLWESSENGGGGMQFNGSPILFNGSEILFNGSSIVFG